MLQLNFRGDKELVTLRIDRVNKKLWITSSKTGYQEKEADWKRLFDSGKETIQDRITSKLDDARFIVIITMSMAKIGYTRIV
jgi:hypothetical protein